MSKEPGRKAYERYCARNFGLHGEWESLTSERKSYWAEKEKPDGQLVYEAYMGEKASWELLPLREKSLWKRAAAGLDRRRSRERSNSRIPSAHPAAGMGIA